jgi:hypothetical protein
MSIPFSRALGGTAALVVLARPPSRSADGDDATAGPGSRPADGDDDRVIGAVERRSARCFRAGCAVEPRFVTLPAYEAARDHLRRLRADTAGGRLMTAAVALDDGALVADWTALRPEVTP